MPRVGRPSHALEPQARDLEEPDYRRDHYDYLHEDHDRRREQRDEEREDEPEHEDHYEDVQKYLHRCFVIDKLLS